MANEERREPQDLGQDPYVEKLRPDPSQPPEAVRIFEGFLGESDRESYRRLYFTRELDYNAEFRVEDVIFSEPIPPDQPPFLGQQATRVGIRRDATIEYARTRAPRPVDEFDLDIRLASSELFGESLRPPKDCTGHRTGCLPALEGEGMFRPRETKWWCTDICRPRETKRGCGDSAIPPCF